MRVVLQRVKNAYVQINGQSKASINKGMLLLLGVEAADTAEDIDWLCNKIVGLRIFSDDDGKMNLSVKDVDGDIIIVSQFTLHANIKKAPVLLLSKQPSPTKQFRCTNNLLGRFKKY